MPKNDIKNNPICKKHDYMRPCPICDRDDFDEESGSYG
jgi:hypothetical protein